LVALLCAVSLAWAALDTALLDQPSADPPVPADSVTKVRSSRDPVSTSYRPEIWSTPENLVAIATVAGTLGLMPFDEAIGEWVRGHRSAVSRGGAAGAKVFGDGYVMIPAVGLLWGIGEWSGSSRLARASRNAFEAWGLTQAVVQSAKQGLRRARPSESTSSQEWHGPGLGSRYLSFPSGHASTAWALLPAFAMEFSDTWWVPALAYAMATSTALSRLHDGQHWASDVFFSAGVGLLSNRVVRNWNAANSRGVEVVPWFGNDRSGVAIVSRF
jgi:membrane-associated phospholipid phosphatase